MTTDFWDLTGFRHKLGTNLGTDLPTKGKGSCVDMYDLQPGHINGV
jgi:hypothetical protein